jgi:FlaA1/EpsC-like NDP-sugar epimerase
MTPTATAHTRTENTMNIMITGAAGNLGSILSRHILDFEKDLDLILMEHCKKVPDDIRNNH